MSSAVTSTSSLVGMAAGFAAIGTTCMLWCRLPPLVTPTGLPVSTSGTVTWTSAFEVDAQEVDVHQPARQRVDLRVADHRRHLLGLAAVAAAPSA